MGAFGFDLCCECCDRVPETPDPVFLDVLLPLESEGEPIALLPAVLWGEDEKVPAPEDMARLEYPP